MTTLIAFAFILAFPLVVLLIISTAKDIKRIEREFDEN